MELYTEVLTGQFACLTVNGGISVPIDDQLDHDGAVAHALLEAMDEWDNWPGYLPDEMLNDGPIFWVRKRAAALMKEWGFEP